MKKRFTLAALAAACCLVSNAGGYSVESLVGSYTASASGWEYFTGEWTALSTGHEVTIEKVDDKTVTISNLLGFNQSLTATLDVNTKTVTIESQTYYKWYTFADSTAVAKGVVGTIDNSGAVKFTNFNAWYNGYKYFYTGAEVTLVKNQLGTLEWTVDGTLTYTNDETGEAYHTATTKLSKYTGATRYDYVLAFDGADASPADVKIKVYDDGDSIAVANGTQTAGYNGGYFYSTYGDSYCIYLEGGAEGTYFKGDQTGGTLSLLYYDYATSTSETYTTGKLIFTWGTSGIKKIAADKANAPIYDLMGRKVSTPKAGLYIQNGKKFVVK